MGVSILRICDTIVLHTTMRHGVDCRLSCLGRGETAPGMLYAVL
jgi:hypothetical protein